MKKYQSLWNKCVHWPRRIFWLTEIVWFSDISAGAPIRQEWRSKRIISDAKFFGLMKKYPSLGNKCAHWPRRIFWLNEIVWFSDISAGAPIQQEWRSKRAISDANSSD